MFLLNPIGRVGSTVDVSIYEIIVSMGFPKISLTWEGPTKSTKFNSSTSEKVVLFGFKTSGGLEVPNG